MAETLILSKISQENGVLDYIFHFIKNEKKNEGTRLILSTIQ